ncbi:hypothetical protein B0H13DRAFT_2666173 [Mycena leptocephala]|nr:hypothetical protein B0H13DRAFT_2666173 [Mycena leptocephala]
MIAESTTRDGVPESFRIMTHAEVNPQQLNLTTTTTTTMQFPSFARLALILAAFALSVRAAPTCQIEKCEIVDGVEVCTPGC